jgi:hypothetical protein
MDRAIRCFTLLATTLSLWVQPVAAERVDICNYQTFQQASGFHCNFTTAAGEWIRVWARYRDTAIGGAYINLEPFTNSLNLGANQQGNIVKKIGVQSVTNARVYYSIGGLIPPGDYLELEVWRDRCNLQVSSPTINHLTGELRLPWSVTTQTPVSTDGYVFVEAWSAASPSSSSQSLNRQWGLAPCINQGNCAMTQSIPLVDRNPIPRGHSWLISKIDPTFAHAETNEGDNVSATFLDDFKLEQVPNIMLARNWAIGAQLLNFWLDGPRRRKSPDIPSFDFELPSFYLANIDTSWFLDPNNATNGRFIDAFNQMRSSFFIPEVIQIFRAKLATRFQNNPGATTLPISTSWVPGPGHTETYHKQHIRRKQAQENYNQGVDPITAAFGIFSFYGVPFGTVVKTPTTFNVTVTSLRFHVLDSFDFNGNQALSILGLGCWAPPSQFSPIWLPGYDCQNNSTVRFYRRLKARGGDYNIFITPITVPLSPPITLTINR